MDVVKYFFRLRLLGYILLSFILSIIFSAVAYTGFYYIYHVLTWILFCQFYLMRIADDYFDYEKDEEKKRKHPKKDRLKILLGIFIALYLWLNFTAYGLSSYMAVLIVALILAQERFKFIQLFIGVVSAFYYLLINKMAANFTIGDMLFLAIVFCISLIFVFVKRSGQV